MNSITSNLKRACAEMFLLRLLHEEDMYGYQMAQQIKKRTNGRFSILEGSMYPILTRLLNKGYVTYENRQITDRLIRVYYHITDEGKIYYKELLEIFINDVEVIKEFMTEGE